MNDNIIEGQMNIYDYNVITKDNLLLKYENIKNNSGLDNIKGIMLTIKMPTGENEIIFNPNVQEKIKYINNVYNENLVHNNGNIRIIDYCFINKDETIQL